MTSARRYGVEAVPTYSLMEKGKRQVSFIRFITTPTSSHYYLCIVRTYTWNNSPKAPIHLLGIAY